MFDASLDATPGSVMQNADLIVPSSSGRSQRSCCSVEPNSASTSMLPVSGAAQFSASGASAGLQPAISASGAYCRFVSGGGGRGGGAEPGDRLGRLTGQEEVPQPAAARLGLEFPGDRYPLPRVTPLDGGLDLFG